MPFARPGSCRHPGCPASPSCHPASSRPDAAAHSTISSHVVRKKYPKERITVSLLKMKTRKTRDCDVLALTAPGLTRHGALGYQPSAASAATRTRGGPSRSQQRCARGPGAGPSGLRPFAVWTHFKITSGFSDASASRCRVGQPDSGIARPLTITLCPGERAPSPGRGTGFKQTGTL